jgi:hypothetical protein
MGEFEFRALCFQSRHSTAWVTPSAHFVRIIFWDRVSGTFCLDYLWTVILLISASWVARITDGSQGHLTPGAGFLFFWYWSLNSGTLLYHFSHNPSSFCFTLQIGSCVSAWVLLCNPPIYASLVAGMTSVPLWPILLVEMGSCFLPGLLSNHNSLHFHLQRSWDYRYEPLCSSVTGFICSPYYRICSFCV